MTNPKKLTKKELMKCYSKQFKGKLGIEEFAVVQILDNSLKINFMLVTGNYK